MLLGGRMAATFREKAVMGNVGVPCVGDAPFPCRACVDVSGITWVSLTKLYTEDLWTFYTCMFNQNF